MSPAKTQPHPEQQAEGLLAEGKHCLALGRRGRAELWLRDVIDLFPETTAAAEAEGLLQQLR